MRRFACPHESCEEAKFCEACGNKLVSACSACGNPALSGAAVCDTCGAALAGAKRNTEEEALSMRKVTVALPAWIGKEEAQEAVLRDLGARALLKMEFYRSKMRPFEVKYATTFSKFQRGVEKSPKEDFSAWDDLLEWEAYYRGYQEWKKRHAELRQWSATLLSCGAVHW